MYVFDVEEVEDATDGFSASRLIGKGSHGCVYRGSLSKGGIHVAVKKQCFQDHHTNSSSKLQNEAQILSSINHPCIINFHGISHDPCNGNTILLTEYMSNGTLHQLLHHASTTTPPLPWRKRAEIALQLAKALCYLHGSNPAIVHRDVKSANILFHDNWNLVKLADFGLAMRLLRTQPQEEEEEEEEKLPAGTMGYIDPSYTTPSMVSTKVDVFSYGVVLLELISGRKAIDMNESPASIVEWAVPLIREGRSMDICDKRLPLPSLYSSRRALGQLLNVAFRCVSACSIRPSMKEVVADLETLDPIHPTPTALPCSSWSMNYIRDMVLSMMRPKKSKLLIINTSTGACKDDADATGCNNSSKGRLLVREILAADITLN